MPSLGCCFDVYANAPRFACRGVERCKQRALQCADEARCLLTVTADRAETECMTTLPASCATSGFYMSCFAAQRRRCILGRTLHVGCFHRTSETSRERLEPSITTSTSGSPSTRGFSGDGSSCRSKSAYEHLAFLSFRLVRAVRRIVLQALPARLRRTHAGCVWEYWETQPRLNGAEELFAESLPLWHHCVGPAA